MNPDVIVYWLATDEGEIHFIDAVLSAYDGVANVRREFTVQDGEAFYKIYVSAGMEAEFLDILDRLRTQARIRDVRRDGPRVEP